MKVSGSVTTMGLFPEDKKRKSEGRNISSLVGKRLIAHTSSLFSPLYCFMMVWKTEVQSSYQPISGSRTFRAAAIRQTGSRSGQMTEPGFLEKGYMSSSYAVNVKPCPFLCMGYTKSVPRWIQDMTFCV